MMSFTYGFAGIALFTILDASHANHRAASRLADCAGGHFLRCAAVISHVASVLLGFATVAAISSTGMRRRCSALALCSTFSPSVRFTNLSHWRSCSIWRSALDTPLRFRDRRSRSFRDIPRANRHPGERRPGRAHRSILRSHRGRPRGCRSDRANAQRVRHRQLSRYRRWRTRCAFAQSRRQPRGQQAYEGCSGALDQAAAHQDVGSPRNISGTLRSTMSESAACQRISSETDL